MKTLLVSLLLICPWLAARAQVFPVQVSIQLTPPYTPYLTDYSAPGSHHLMVQIILNDLSVTEYRCKLRLTIEGVGIQIQSKPDYAFQPVVLEGEGLPQVFYGSDIAEYFFPAALNFRGLSREDYRRRARLPEGVYRFTVEVLDYHRGTVVSNQASATAWIMLNDPPVLNLPFNHTTVPLQDPPNILFSWTPRHTSSPNAAFTTMYSFRLIELWPDDRNPNDAVLAQAPLYETTTQENALLYGPGEPPLIPGRKYAWQIQAHDAEGRDLFKNHGKSEVFVFQYGESLAIPGRLRMRWAKPTTLAIQWDAIRTDGDVRYRLQYRPHTRDDEDHEWYETWTRFTDKTLYHLKTNTAYEMRIRSENALQESEYSGIHRFTTLREVADKFVCRDDIQPPPAPENTFPAFPLSVNDTVHAGGYSVLVRDVVKIGSRYDGSGLAIVPWLNEAKVRVTFEKITVNDRFWLTAGTIKSVWQGKDSKFHIEEQTPITPGKAPQAGELDITIVSTDSTIAVHGAVLVAVTKDEDENIIITTSDGREQVLPKGKSVAITDEVGNGYVIDDKGNIAKTTSREATTAAQRGERSYDIALHFEKAEGTYGFDARKFDALSHYYQRLDNGSYVPWKSLSSATPDNLRAVMPASGIEVSKLEFESGGTTVAPVAQNGNKLELRLQGKAGGMEEELLALYRAVDTIPPTVVGKVNLVTYNPVHYNLEIIPVNDVVFPGGLDAGAISRHLNTVYGQGVVSWNVTVKSSLPVALGDLFDDGGNGTISNYTGDMKKVLNAYGLVRDNTWCLFIVDRPRDFSTLGYMPRNKRAGFVFSAPHDGDANDFLKTIAHELGHGAFNLKHTFSEHPLPVGATDNLMDYNDGTALYKYQWDYMHEPRISIGLFEGGGESENLKSGLASFYSRAAPLLLDPHYQEWIEKVRKVYEFLEGCHDEGWESYDGKGIFPYCFWRDQNVSPLLRYSIADMAFTAGLVDGGYIELNGMYQLPDVLREISKLPGKLLYAYTLAYWRCRDSQLFASFQEYEYVVDQLAEMDGEGGLWNWVREQWHDYKGEKVSLENYFKECKEAEDLRETVEDLYELATNWEQIKTLSTSVVDNFKVYWDTLGTGSNHGRYERGALIIPTATLFLPLGIGVGSKVEKVKAVLRLLQEASKDNLKKIATEVAEVMWVRGGKLLTPFTKQFYDKCIKGGYKVYHEGGDIIIANVDNTVVGKISDNLLHIKIPHENGWARQSTSKLAITTLEKVETSRRVYRLGTLKQSATSEAQYWAPESPFDYPNIWAFAESYGIPKKNLLNGDVFLEIGKVSDNTPYITREAAAFGEHRGGAIEIVVPSNGVKLETFSTIEIEKP